MNATIVLVMNLWIFVCALVGSIYGGRQFFRPRKALYLQMITAGIICLMYSGLFKVIYLLTQGGLGSDFHVGVLGVIGSFMCFLSANYGQMDRLVDDGTKTFRATRIKAFFAPFLVLCLYLVFFFLVKDLPARITIGIVSFFMMQCSYYSFKHIIIHDVELGLIRAVRKYNILVTVYVFLTGLEFIAEFGEYEILYIITCAGVGIIVAAIPFVVKGGVERWTL
ncbi:MAG: hypothetical protein K5639_00510 [Eubacterium sp.]|nr:hypothetical protein [Eubacterium sp.]